MYSHSKNTYPQFKLNIESQGMGFDHGVVSFITPSEETEDKDGWAEFSDRMERSGVIGAQKEGFEKDIALNSTEQRMQYLYNQDGLVLFLGAGVSVKSGIPSWTTLAEMVIAEASNLCYSELNGRFPELITQFELAHSLCKSTLDFYQKLWCGLYNNLLPKDILKQALDGIPRGRQEQEGHQIWSKIEKALAENNTLASVGNLLFFKNSTRRNDKIHSVLTVNADNLLSLYCRARTKGFRNAQFTDQIDSPHAGGHLNRTPIFHLHGCLDARGEKFEKDQDFDESLLPPIVFRETEYYDTFFNTNHMVNNAPLSQLQRFNVLFIGTSLVDVNLRRWLYASYKERVAARLNYLRALYPNPVAKEQRGAMEEEAHISQRRHFWLTTGGGMCLKMREATEKLMSKFGVNIIWCKDHAEVAKKIAELHASSTVSSKK